MKISCDAGATLSCWKIDVVQISSRRPRRNLRADRVRELRNLPATTHQPLTHRLVLVRPVLDQLRSIVAGDSGYDELEEVEKSGCEQHRSSAAAVGARRRPLILSTRIVHFLGPFVKGRREARELHLEHFWS